MVSFRLSRRACALLVVLSLLGTVGAVSLTPLAASATTVEPVAVATSVSPVDPGTLANQCELSNGLGGPSLRDAQVTVRFSNYVPGSHVRWRLFGLVSPITQVVMFGASPSTCTVISSPSDWTDVVLPAGSNSLTLLGLPTDMSDTAGRVGNFQSIYVVNGLGSPTATVTGLWAQSVPTSTGPTIGTTTTTVPGAIGAASCYNYRPEVHVWGSGSNVRVEVFLSQGALSSPIVAYRLYLGPQATTSNVTDLPFVGTSCHPVPKSVYPTVDDLGRRYNGPAMSYTCGSAASPCRKWAITHLFTNVPSPAGVVYFQGLDAQGHVLMFSLNTIRADVSGAPVTVGIPGIFSVNVPFFNAGSACSFVSGALPADVIAYHVAQLGIDVTGAFLGDPEVAQETDGAIKITDVALNETVKTGGLTTNDYVSATADLVINVTSPAMAKYDAPTTSSVWSNARVQGILQRVGLAATVESYVLKSQQIGGKMVPFLDVTSTLTSTLGDANSLISSIWNAKSVFESVQRTCSYLKLRS